jgi:hypothetical protein
VVENALGRICQDLELHIPRTDKEKKEKKERKGRFGTKKMQNQNDFDEEGSGI